MPEYDVAIIGLGPVGCTAAILFAEAGLRVVAVERDQEIYALPRAVNLDGEIIRAFQKVGRGQVVQDLMQPVRPGDRAGFANSRREWLFGQEARAFGRNGWQPMNMFDQPEFESYLREQAIGQDNVTAFVGYEATQIHDEQGSVSISFDSVSPDAGAIAPNQTVSARYLVACDGASSTTRKALDIGWVDLGYDHHWLVVDVTIKAGHTLTNDTVQVCDPDRIHTYVCTKDPYRRWEFKMLPGETPEQMLDHEKIYALIDPWTPRGTYAIRRAAVYQFHAANADRWRVGQVFIAGDAAHQTPPFLGQGMNAGMRDVINLAWKIPMVIRGLAKDALLNTYATERKAHAHDLVAWAVSIGQLMEHTAEQERCARAGLEAPPTPTKLQSSGYGQGREQPPIREGVVMVEQVSNTGSAGYLFNQPIVRNSDADRDGCEGTDKEYRLDELLGAGFAVVTRDAAPPLLSDSSRATLKRLGAPVVSVAGLDPVKGRFDSVFKEHDAVIVRPDALVFGHTTSDFSLDELIGALADKLALEEDTK